MVSSSTMGHAPERGLNVPQCVHEIFEHLDLAYQLVFGVAGAAAGVFLSDYNQRN